MKWLEKKLNESPISYFSDLFMVVMVLGWILAVIIVTLAAAYAMLRLDDTSVWSYTVDLVRTPLEVGGAVWLIKCAAQHAIAYSKGKTAKQDFPRVEGAEEIEIEEEITASDEAETEEEDEI